MTETEMEDRLSELFKETGITVDIDIGIAAACQRFQAINWMPDGRGMYNVAFVPIVD